jgi:hypothetical protein
LTVTLSGAVSSEAVMAADLHQDYDGQPRKPQIYPSMNLAPYQIPVPRMRSTGSAFLIVLHRLDAR